MHEKTHTSQVTQRKWLITIVISIASFLVAANSTGINTLLPTLSDELDSSAASLQWIVNAYMLVTAATIVTGGQLGDIIGLRKVFSIGSIIFAISSIIIALSTNEISLVAGRAAQGLAAGALIPGTLSILRVTFPEKQQPLALSIWAAVIGLAFALGPIFASVCNGVVNWQFFFWLNVPIMSLVAVLTVVLLPKPVNKKNRQTVDIAGFILLGTALFAIILALEQSQQWGWLTFKTIGVILAGLILLAGFVIVEQRISSPMIRLSHFRKGAYVAGCLTTLLETFMIFSVLFIFNLYLQSFLIFDYSAIKASAALTPFSGMLFLSSLSVSFLVKRFNQRAIISTGCIILTAGFVILSFASISSGYNALWPGLLILGVGIGITLGPMSETTLDSVDKSQTGEASGVVNASRYLGAAIGVAVSAAVYKSTALNKLNSLLSSHKVDITEKTHLDNILVGTQTVAEHAIAKLPLEIRSEFLHAARESILTAFTSVTEVNAGVAALALLVTILLIRPHQSKQSD